LNESLPVACPYCGEILYVEPEPSDQAVEYVEDCHVCCQPIMIRVEYSEDGSQVFARRENE
jgi:Cysteine-rich CPXCG